MRIFWAIALMISLAILLALILHPWSPTVRLANLDLEDTGLQTTYLMFSKSNPGRGYVVNRRDSTMRRGDRKQPGRKWDLDRIPGREGAPDAWLVKNKNKGKGTVFYVPARCSRSS